MNFMLTLKTVTSLYAIITVYTSDAQDIRLPPGIIAGPIPGLTIFNPQSPVTLVCQADGYPTPTYTWLRNGTSLDTSGSNYNLYPNVGTIDIISPTVADQGYYQCRATNDYGTTMSNVSFLQMADLGQYSTSGKTNTSVQLNGLLSLPCRAPYSVPDATISWSYNTTSLSQTTLQISTRVQIDFSGNLCYANVISSTELPSNLYRCNVANDVTSVTRSGAYTYIQISGSVTSASPAPFFSSPSQVVGLETQPITLRCFFSGSPTPNYAWTYNGSAILPTGWSPVITDVRTSALKPSDAGLYVCQGSNNQETASVTIQLTVDALPVFQSLSQQPHNMNATQGTSVTIVCYAYARPNATVQWFKNGNAFSRSNLPPKFAISVDSLSVTIANLCKNCSDGTTDLMSIQCNASNYHGYVFAQGYINVILPTTVTSTSATTIWTPNQNVQFQCSATSDPSTPITRQWLFNGNPITQSQTIYVDSYGALNIITANDTDGGVSRIGDYTCVVSNDYSTASVVSYLTGSASTASAQFWWIGLIIALIIILLLLLIVCCFFGVHLREGKSYPVDEHERKNGGDPVNELQKTGFHSYQPQTPVNVYTNPVGNDTAALLPKKFGGSIDRHTDDPDDTSLNVYSHSDLGGKFNEDGSFIGQYRGQGQGQGQAKTNGPNPIAYPYTSSLAATHPRSKGFDANYSVV